MEDFPVELLCFILSKLDGCSLARASQVCKKWQDIITDILCQGFNIWFRRCMSDIGIDRIVCLTKRTDLLMEENRKVLERKGDESDYWRDVYTQFFRHRLVRKWTVRETKLEHHLRNKVMAAVGPGGKNIMAGDLRGNMEIYERSSSTDIHEFRTQFICHHGAITDLIVVTLEGSQEEYVVSISQDGYINLSSVDEASLELRTKPTFRYGMNMAAFGPYFISATDMSMAEGIRVYKLYWRKGDGLQADTVLRLRGLMYGDVCAVAMTHDTILAGDSHGVLYVWEIPPLLISGGTSGKKSERLVYQPDFRSGEKNIPQPVLTMQFKAQVSQIAYTGGQAVVLLGNASIYVVFDPKGKCRQAVQITPEALAEVVGMLACPQSIRVRGSLLVIGCHFGLIALFDISDEHWYKNLRANLLTTVLDNLGCNVTSVSVEDDGDGILVVTGGSVLRRIVWRRPGSVDPAADTPGVNEAEFEEGSPL